MIIYTCRTQIRALDYPDSSQVSCLFVQAIFENKSRKSLSTLYAEHKEETKKKSGTQTVKQTNKHFQHFHNSC